MDVAGMFAALSGKETPKMYDFLKRLEAVSDDSDAVYPYLDDMISMLKSEKYTIRVRGFRQLYRRTVKEDKKCIISKGIACAARSR